MSPIPTVQGKHSLDNTPGQSPLMLWFPVLDYKKKMIASLFSRLLYFARNLKKNGLSISPIQDSICFSEIISKKILRFQLKEVLSIYL